MQSSHFRRFRYFNRFRRFHRFRFRPLVGRGAAAAPHPPGHLPAGPDGMEQMQGFGTGILNSGIHLASWLNRTRPKRKILEAGPGRAGAGPVRPGR